MPNIGDESLWDDEGFRQRAAAALKAKGMEPRDIKKAGVDVNYLSKHADKGGRQIAPMLKIAKFLDMDPAELMGFRSDPTKIESEESARLRLAIDIAIHLYIALDAQDTIPSGIDGAKIASALISILEASRDHR